MESTLGYLFNHAPTFGLMVVAIWIAIKVTRDRDKIINKMDSMGRRMDRGDEAHGVIKAELRDSFRDAKESRREIYVKIDAIEDRLTKIETTIEVGKS